MIYAIIVLSIVCILLFIRGIAWMRLVKAQRDLLNEYKKTSDLQQEITTILEKAVESRDKIIEVQDDMIQKLKKVCNIPHRPGDSN